MKTLFSCLALAFFIATNGAAQTAIPARPVDPDQAIPAQPVGPIPATPVTPATPAVPATPATPAPATATPVTDDSEVAVSIIADSSLKQVLQELAQAWANTQDTGPQVPLTLTNAGTIRSKIESGAVWDVVISADVNDVKALTDKSLLFADGQHSLARNTLVIYGRKALVKDDELDWFDMIGTEWKKVALGNPDLVESGRVAKRALQKHDLINDDHKDTYVYESAEVLALAVAQREQAQAIFIYKTDVPKPGLPGFEVFPLKTEDAPPVFYTAAVCRLAKNATQARAFIDFCGSEPAKAIWAKYGFETN